MIHANSLHAYETKIKPELTPREAAVLLEVSKHQGLCMREYADIMQVGVHQISGRFSGLKNKGKIKEDGSKTFPGSKQTHTKWVLVGEGTNG